MSLATRSGSGRIASLIAVLLWASSSLAGEVPPLTGRIVDLAGILSSSDVAQLTTELSAHEARTGNQIALLTVRSLKGEPLETFSHRVATMWKLGRPGVDNGVLVLIVTEDRRIRLEVGYGLEGLVTDAVAARIIRREMVPRFRTGDYAGGILDGIRAVMVTIEGRSGDPEPPPSDMPEAWDPLFLGVIVGAVIGGLIGSQRLLRGGSIGGLITFVMAVSGGLLWAVGAAALGTVGAVVLGMLFRSGGGRFHGLGEEGVWTASWPRGRRHDRGGDVFIGGGGGFGGGGASGRW